MRTHPCARTDRVNQCVAIVVSLFRSNVETANCLVVDLSLVQLIATNRIQHVERAGGKHGVGQPGVLPFVDDRNQLAF